VTELERIVAGLAEKIERRFFGKYRATVVDNQDPSRLGRLKLKVPSVLGPDVVTGWATPCAPYGGAADQGFLFVPARDAGVWAEFEEGDPEFPIWVGAYWSRPGDQSQLPKPQESDGTEQSEVQDPPTCKVIKTAKGHTVQFEDADGAEAVLIREGRNGHLITLDKNGVTIVDKDKNTILLDQHGVKITDTNDNVVELSGSAFTLTAKVPFKIDAAGQTVTIVAASIDLQKG
jgi:uncharacterized protein involved in type VI secretion and phage assembly